MVLIQLYAVFAITTAIVTLFGIFLPLVNEAREKGIENILTESRLIASAIFFSVTLVLAPFVFPAIIMPTQAELFRIGLQRVVEKPDD